MRVVLQTFLTLGSHIKSVNDSTQLWALGFLLLSVSIISWKLTMLGVFPGCAASSCF